MNQRAKRKWNRRGLAIPEWFCILALLGLAIVAVLTPFGETLRDYTSTTAEGVADPGQLVDSPQLNGPPPGRSPRKGNNGVGNGLDPQPPGNPPINDGPGTCPGNPGNKGGAKK